MITKTKVSLYQQTCNTRKPENNLPFAAISLFSFADGGKKNVSLSRFYIEDCVTTTTFIFMPTCEII